MYSVFFLHGSMSFKNSHHNQTFNNDQCNDTFLDSFLINNDFRIKKRLIMSKLQSLETISFLQFESKVTPDLH